MPERWLPERRSGEWSRACKPCRSETVWSPIRVGDFRRLDAAVGLTGNDPTITETATEVFARG